MKIKHFIIAFIIVVGLLFLSFYQKDADFHNLNSKSGDSIGEEDVNLKPEEALLDKDENTDEQDDIVDWDVGKNQYGEKKMENDVNETIESEEILEMTEKKKNNRLGEWDIVP